MEVWTPYPEEENSTNYNEKDKNEYPLSTIETTNSNLYVVDEHELPSSLSDPQPKNKQKKNKKRKQKEEDEDKEMQKIQKLLSDEYPEQEDTESGYGVVSSEGSQFNINELSDQSHEHHTYQHMVLPDYSIPINAQTITMSSDDPAVPSMVMTGMLPSIPLSVYPPIGSGIEHPLQMFPMSTNYRLANVYEEKPKQKLEGVLKALPTPMCKTRAKWWWLLQAERLKQQGTPTAPQASTVPSNPPPISTFTLNPEQLMYDPNMTMSGSNGNSPRLPPRSRLKDLLDWVQQQNTSTLSAFKYLAPKTEYARNDHQ